MDSTLGSAAETRCIGTSARISSPRSPTGYTLLAFHAGLAYNAALYPKLPFATVRDTKWTKVIKQARIKPDE